MPEITRRNAERTRWTSGWGVINRGLASACDSVDNLDAPIQLYMSPPYSFEDLDPTKFNVGLTMGERDDLGSYQFPFVENCNKMDLLIVPGSTVNGLETSWQKQVFQKNGVKPPIVSMLLGHNHADWYRPVRERDNRSVFIMGRGREHGGSVDIVSGHFEDVNYMDCRAPKGKELEAMEPDERAALLEQGRYTPEELQAAYGEADIFFKWSREGWCYPILEAMSAGCLVITNCHTLPYLRHHVNCLIFRDLDELGQTLRYASGHHCNDIKLRGQETAASLTWERAGSELRRLILEHYRA
jgi:glycosyltransferase involved in cell wall biosynthesis